MAVYNPVTVRRFQRFVESALESSPGPGTVGVRMFRVRQPAPGGGHVAVFYAPGVTGAAVAATLPGTRSASARVSLADAVGPGAGFEQVDGAEQVRAALRGLSRALTEELDGTPKSILILERHVDGPWADAAAEAPGPSVEQSGDRSSLRDYLEHGDWSDTIVHVTFHMLALDVLSGRPEPRGSAPDLVDSYEVWGYRHHPNAVAIIRSFDAGAAVACGAFMPDELATDERFARAVERLVELRVPGASYPPTTGKLSDLEQLETVPAFERIARALALNVECKGLETHPGLTGTPSELTLGYLETLRLLAPFDEDEEGKSPLFQAMADNFLEEPECLRWTGARERAKSERMEVLVHVANPAVTVLVHFGLPSDPPTVAAYLPPLDDETSHDRIVDDVRAMITARALAGATPEALPNNGQFRRLGDDRALAQLEAILDDIKAGDGCMHEFVLGPVPSAPDLDTDSAEGTRRLMH